MGFSNFNNDIALESTFPLKTDKSVVKKQKTNGEKESKANKSPLFWIKDRNIDLPE